MEAALLDFKRMLGGGGHDASTPEGHAQDLIYDAWETESPRKRQELARKALALWPDCADAYVLLAEAEDGLEARLALFEKGVAAGERALGPETFQEDAGDFWGILETRPYMRARAGLARCLWLLGRREEAVAHLQDMLRLNPGDNQGLRDALASYLAELGQDDALARLLQSYEDDASAVWDYTRVLLAFRKDGDTPETRRLLEAARAGNPHVPALLLGRKRMPRELPGLYSLGDESEAILYVAEGRAAWEATAGALDWLARACGMERATAERVSVVGGVDLRRLLTKSGKRLSVGDRKSVLSLGEAAVPALLDVLEDEELRMVDGPGKGWAPIHAARLLGELKPEAAAPRMVRVLGELEVLDLLFSELIQALVKVGPAAAPAALEALDEGEADEETGLLEVLSKCGARSESIFTLLCEAFREEPILGAALLADYGDARALPLLHEVFNVYEPSAEEPALFAGQALIEIEDAIRELGGTLSPEQQRKLEKATGGRGDFFEVPEPARRRERPERNAPCWCGSGKKYKQCHLAADEGRGG